MIQRRVDASVNFARNWSDYKSGFGCSFGNLWIGLERLHCLAGPGKGAILNITLQTLSQPDKVFYAGFTLFEIGSEAGGYRLTVGGYSGTAGDSLILHNGMKFSTYDRDNDVWGRNCAAEFKGGWWHKSCFTSNLNNFYPDRNMSGMSKFEKFSYMSWKTLDNGEGYGSVLKSEMKIKITEKAKNC